MSRDLEKWQDVGITPRQMKIEQLVVRAKTDSGLSVPGVKEMQVIAASAAELLTGIPDDALNECYVRARRNHDPERPFQFQAIYKEWLVMAENGEYASKLKLLPEVACSCIDGWIIVNKDGKRAYGDERGYAKKCDHDIQLESLPMASDEAIRVDPEEVKQGIARLKLAVRR